MSACRAPGPALGLPVVRSGGHSFAHEPTHAGRFRSSDVTRYNVRPRESTRILVFSVGLREASTTGTPAVVALPVAVAARPRTTTIVVATRLMVMRATIARRARGNPRD